MVKLVNVLPHTSYPALYLFCIAPMSVSRWIDWSRPNYHPAAAIIFGHVVLSLSGVLNVILFSVTRPSLVAGNTASLAVSEGESAGTGQQPPSNTNGEQQQSTCPSSYEHKPLTACQSIVEKVTGSSMGRSVSSTIDTDGEHDSDKHHPLRSSLPARTSLQTVKTMNTSQSHGHLPDC